MALLLQGLRSGAPAGPRRRIQVDLDAAYVDLGAVMSITAQTLPIGINSIDANSTRA